MLFLDNLSKKFLWNFLMNRPDLPKRIYEHVQILKYWLWGTIKLIDVQTETYMENWTIKPTIGSTVCSLNTDLSLLSDHTATPTHYSENTQIKLPQHPTTTAKTGKYTYGFKTQVKNNKNGFCKVMKQKCYSIHYNIFFDCSECHLYSSMDLLIIKKVQLVLVCGAAPPFDTLNTYIFLSRFGASCLHSFDSQPVKRLGGAEVLPKHNTWVSISLKKSTVHEVTKVLQAHCHNISTTLSDYTSLY